MTKAEEMRRLKLEVLQLQIWKQMPVSRAKFVINHLHHPHHPHHLHLPSAYACLYLVWYFRCLSETQTQMMMMS